MASEKSIAIVEKLDSLLKDQPEHCLRPHQRIELEEEAARLNTVVKAPDWQAGAAKVQATERYKRVVGMLAKQAAHEIENPMQHDEVNRLHKEVLETVIQPAMLTRAEMRRNPAGAVGEFMRRENSKPVQKAIRVWKKARFALDPHTQDDEHALIEKHRKEGTPWDGTSTFMGDAQIPGKFAMTPKAKENWPLPEPETTAIKQVVAREKRIVTQEQKDKMAAGRAAAKAARLAAGETK